jgi:hypothetical protein
MKAILYALIPLLLFANANPAKISPDKEFQKRLIGKWKFTGHSGGTTGESSPAKENTVNVIEFRVGGKYVRYTNGEPMFQGDYQLSKTKSIFTGKVDNAIIFDPKLDSANALDILTINGDTLVLAKNSNDGYISGYIKIN